LIHATNNHSGSEISVDEELMAKIRISQYNVKYHLMKNMELMTLIQKEARRSHEDGRLNLMYQFYMTGGALDAMKSNVSRLLQVAPKSFLCPLTHMPFVDPVVAGDGHTYERSAINKWFRSSNKSPMTNAQLSSLDQEVRPNRALKDAMQTFEGIFTSAKATSRKRD
jgi:hypothetical protein